MALTQPVCWAITDQAAGNQRQALALAERLRMPVRHLILEPQAPWSWLAPRLTIGGRWALPISQRPLFTAPWPAVAIGCGRSAALLTRRLRPLAQKCCYTVQILDPRCDTVHWDTVIAPKHDQLRGDNVLQTVGSLNPIDDAWLADGREASPALAEWPRPRVGVLLGGPRHGLPFDHEYLKNVFAQLIARQREEGGSLLVLASQRTPSTAMTHLRGWLRDIPGLLWTGRDDGRNPYPGVLGWADRLVVTPDSVNMLSEACAVGCAVHTLAPASLPAKLARFHATLRDAGLLHDIGVVTADRQPPLRETAAISETLLTRMAARHAGRRDEAPT